MYVAGGLREGRVCLGAWCMKSRVQCMTLWDGGANDGGGCKVKGQNHQLCKAPGRPGDSFYSSSKIHEWLHDAADQE